MDNKIYEYGHQGGFMTVISSSQNPEEAFRIALSRYALHLRTFLPAIVDSEPKKNGRFWCVDVIPSIRRVVTDAEGLMSTKDIAKIANVPLYLAGSIGSGLTITIPVKIGDNCLLAICDRGIDNWQLADGQQNPPEIDFEQKNLEIRHHDLTDAICIPLGSTLEAIESYNNEAIEIRDKTSETVLSVKSGEIKSLVGSAMMTMTDGSLSIKANVSIDGDFSASNGVFTHDGVNVGKDHQHGITDLVPTPNGTLKDSLSGPVTGLTGVPKL